MQKMYIIFIEVKTEVSEAHLGKKTHNTNKLVLQRISRISLLLLSNDVFTYIISLLAVV